MSKGKNVLTTGEVAKICNVAPRTVSKWFDNDQLKGYRIPGSKDRRIPIEELLSFMKKYNMPTEGLEREQKNILVVDTDKSAAANTASALMEKTDYSVSVVCSCVELGAKIEQLGQAVVVLCRIPSGLSLAGFLNETRSEDKLSKCPLIGISEHIAGGIEELRSHGIEFCVPSATNIEQIAYIIEQF
jgi:excisionase family DNA binding protein